MLQKRRKVYSKFKLFRYLLHCCFQIHLHWTIIENFKRGFFAEAVGEKSKSKQTGNLECSQTWCCFIRKIEYTQVCSCNGCCEWLWLRSGWSGSFFAWFLHYNNRLICRIKQYHFCGHCTLFWMGKQYYEMWWERKIFTFHFFSS